MNRRHLERVCDDRDEVPRPCPHRRCRYHMRARTEAGPTCVFDVVDDNAKGMTLESIGDLLGVSWQAVLQTEVQALGRLQPFFQDRTTLRMHLRLLALQETP